MTQETLREAVARVLCELRIRAIRRHDTPPDELEAMLPAAVNHVWREHLPQADAAIATMFERLRTPSEGMMEAGEHAWMNRDLNDPASHPIRDCFRAMLTAFQQEDSDDR